MSKLNNNQKEKIKEMYKEGQFTRKELSQIFKVHSRTIDRILGGIIKPFKYDAMNIGVSSDQLKDRGKEIPDYTYEPFQILTREPEYVKVVTCPQCTYKTTANKLIVHLVKIHKRFDLEYLL